MFRLKKKKTGSQKIQMTQLKCFVKVIQLS